MRLFSRELLLNSGGKFEPITFNVGGSTTEWVVPAGIKKIRVECVACAFTSENISGYGGKVDCVLAVTKSQSIFITVANSDYNSSYISTAKNDMNTRIVVAGGGGLGNSGLCGGPGGGLVGATGGTSNASYYATGGGQTSGGVIVGGGVGAIGSFGSGGRYYTHKGGDGWYGGASSGSVIGFNKPYYAGGGGSSYTHPTLCSDVVHTQGFNARTTGWVTISMV